MRVKVYLLDSPLLDYARAFLNDLNYLLGCGGGHSRNGLLPSPFSRWWFWHDDETQAPITKQLRLKAKALHVRLSEPKGRRAFGYNSSIYVS